MKRLIRKLNRFLAWLLIALGVLSVVSVILCMILGIRFVTVLTPSMTASGVPAGAGVLVAPIQASDIQQGDVIFATSPTGDSVLHEAQNIPVKDDAGRMQLTMKGSSNPAPDAYTYDVTDGVHEAIWSAAGLGQMSQSLWSPIPGTQQLVPGFAGVPIATPFIFALLLWMLWPSKRHVPIRDSESAPELRSPAISPR